MLRNILEAVVACPGCGASVSVGWEFSGGALAGERYELGDLVRTDEPWSFYRRFVATGDEADLSASALCPSCDADLDARIQVRERRVVAVVDVAVATPTAAVPADAPRDKR